MQVLAKWDDNRHVTLKLFFLEVQAPYKITEKRTNGRQGRSTRPSQKTAKSSFNIPTDEFKNEIFERRFPGSRKPEDTTRRSRMAAETAVFCIQTSRIVTGIYRPPVLRANFSKCSGRGGRGNLDEMLGRWLNGRIIGVFSGSKKRAGNDGTDHNIQRLIFTLTLKYQFRFYSNLVKPFSMCNKKLNDRTRSNEVTVVTTFFTLKWIFLFNVEVIRFYIIGLFQ